ncbi:MAG: amino acid transporter [Methylomonas sp.]|nr:MAG: amino acid transporter [Methylomonas sp.]
MQDIINWTDLFKDFVGIFAILNPLGAIPVYLSMTANKSESEVKRIAIKTAMAVAIILVISIWTGSAVLQFFGITMPAFRIASGLLVLLVAISMFHAKSSGASHTHQETLEAAHKDDIAIVPLAIPLLAGPGAISLVIVNVNQMDQWFEKILLTVGIFILAAVIWLTLRIANSLGQLMGTAGINTATRIMGLLLAAMAVQFMILGLVDAFPGLADKS